MQACEGVERDLNRVSDKFQALKDSNEGNLTDALNLVLAAKREITEGKYLFLSLFYTLIISL